MATAARPKLERNSIARPRWHLWSESFKLRAEGAQGNVPVIERMYTSLSKACMRRQAPLCTLPCLPNPAINAGVCWNVLRHAVTCAALARMTVPARGSRKLCAARQTKMLPEEEQASTRAERGERGEGRDVLWEPVAGLALRSQQ